MVEIPLTFKTTKTMELQKFISEPIKGEKMKIYKDIEGETGCLYGYAKEIIEKVFIDGTIANPIHSLKQVVVVELSDIPFEFNEIDYFFPIDRIEIFGQTIEETTEEEQEETQEVQLSLF